jgi:hypothetical protein
MEMALSLRNHRSHGVELVMPQNSIALDSDEMEYVDGGSYVKRESWVLYVHLTPHDCSVIAADLRMGMAGSAAIAAVCGAASAGVGTTIFGVLSGCIGVDEAIYDRGAAGNGIGANISIINTLWRAVPGPAFFYFE